MLKLEIEAADAEDMLKQLSGLVEAFSAPRVFNSIAPVQKPVEAKPSPEIVKPAAPKPKKVSASKKAEAERDALRRLMRDLVAKGEQEGDSQFDNLKKMFEGFGVEGVAGLSEAQVPEASEKMTDMLKALQSS